MTQTDFIWNPAIARLFRRLRRNIALPSDCGPATLAESPLGLDMPLTPVQRLILRLIGDSHFRPDTKRDGSVVCALDPELSEAYARLAGPSVDEMRLWLPPGVEVKSTGEGNESSRQSLQIVFESPITLLLCVAGRRSGKTTIAATLMAWLARRVLIDEAFLESLPVLPSSDISLLNMACDTNQAKILFRMLAANLARIDLLSSRRPVSERLRIGRLLIESLSSSSRSSRGRTACGVCFDEFAHFQRTNGPLADRSVWAALMPSLATFGPRGLGVITTSPAGKSGIVWDLFTQRGEREGMLTLQLPTWEMNPLVPRERLEDEFARDETMARQEYGAEFLDPQGLFLDIADIRACVRAVTSPSAGKVSRHMHVDLGLKHDSTAIAVGFIAHDTPDAEPNRSAWAPDFHVVIETVEVMRARTGQDLSVLEIEEKIVALASSMGVATITFDQHQSAYLVERLTARGYNAWVFNATAKSNWETYSFLKGLISARQITLPDDDRLINELASLACSPTSDAFRVEAPPQGSDDCADAVACCAWLLVHNTPSWKDLFSVVEKG